MKDRINKCRKQSLDIKPYFCAERAKLITDFFESDDSKSCSIPVGRALAFKYLMENKTICINEGELIVGERGSAPKATPTYPEICSHSIKDLEILDTREKVSFSVDDSVKEIYREKIIPFWKGKSLRERIFNALDDDWKNAYTAGVFTEFQEQRAPGHTVNGDKIYKKGFVDIKKDIEKSLNSLDFINDKEAYHKREELKAMKISADALITYAKRHVKELKKLAKIEANPLRKAELLQMAEICKKVPKHKPETFHEALQYYWFVHVGVITEYNTWDSFNPGRLDQHLYPFYVKGLKDGSLTKEYAKELLQSFWVKFNNQPAPPKVGITAKESNTYTDFALINLGGLKEDGSDAVNELTYLILDVIEEMRILQPSSMVQISKKNSDRYLRRALKIIKTGFGQPSIFNIDTIVQQLVRQGKSIEDARNGGASGCVESGAFGKEAYFLTGYFNLTKILELSYNNGFDTRTNKQIGLKTGNANSFKSFEDFMKAFEKQVHYFANIKIKGNNIIERFFAEERPAPFLSILIDDCIKNGVDYNAGGARYNTSYIQGVGIGSITDSLAAIKYFVFDNKIVSFDNLVGILKDNFKGKEDFRKQLVYLPHKYGNDDDYADDITKETFEIFYNAVNGKPNTRGGVHRINLLPTTVHVYFGSVIGALPYGRKAFEPLSEGISPVQGADREGPTAVIKSASKIDHIRTGGTLLNQKFTPDILNNEEGINKLLYLVRSYFKMDGHHIQFNVVNADTLRKAKKEPEKFRDLIVRVAGYSDYFVDLTEPLQDEIINRTEHQIF